ncbi:PEP-CTERM sorting domain-containing protein [Psychromonas arctica]|uniref:PEP-CTERM sorting domain-containing protein n=1 Tax=Psychromonas arctica TaxID=168275 RepID=A0ABU9HEK9_9GAMM
MKKFITLITSSFLLFLATSSAYATPIEGVIRFTGSATVTGTYPTISSIAFTDTYVSLTDANVTGDFDGLEGWAATFTDYTFGDSLPYVLWAVDSFTFTATNFSIDSLNPALGGGLTGTISGSGFLTSTDPLLDTTSGLWAITGELLNGQVSFSATTVPAPAGAALLGLSLLGFGFARRNKKAK